MLRRISFEGMRQRQHRPPAGQRLADPDLQAGGGRNRRQHHIGLGVEGGGVGHAPQAADVAWQGLRRELLTDRAGQHDLTGQQGAAQPRVQRRQEGCGGGAVDAVACADKAEAQHAPPRGKRHFPRRFRMRQHHHRRGGGAAEGRCLLALDGEHEIGARQRDRFLFLGGVEEFWRDAGGG